MSSSSNSHFQTAIGDPVRNITSHLQRAYISGSSSDASPPLILGTLTVIVGPESNSRQWSLPKALLAQHSTFFADFVQDPANQVVRFRNMEPREFQNYVDYMNSSIYSPNTQIKHFRAIRAHSAACVLGAILGAKEYHDAAIRHLYGIVQPLAILAISNARISWIRASDIEYICQHTAAIGVCGVRQLLFDAVASHWTQHDALNVGENDMPTDTATWTDVYNTYPGFRIVLSNILNKTGIVRSDFLRPVDEYLNPRAVEAEINDADSKTTRSDNEVAVVSDDSDEVITEEQAGTDDAQVARDI